MPRRIRWAATILTAPAKARRKSSSAHIAVRSLANRPVRIASARAGNVIGGGDWALDRIVPDCIRALQRGETIPVRNPHATRPWQHVLEPLSGYLWLAATLLSKLPPSNDQFASPPSTLARRKKPTGQLANSSAKY